MPGFENAGASLVALCPQTVEMNAAVVASHKLTFPVLSDPGNAYAAQLGLRHGFPDDLKQIYRDFGIDLPAHNGDDSWTLPLPARIVVDAGGVVRSVQCDPDYTHRPEPEDTIARLAGL